MTAHLSPTLNLIADVIGLAAALKLAEHFGGTEIYVPLRIREDHPVARAIGVEAALLLARELGGHTGVRIDMPKADEVTRARRNQAIVAAEQAGVTKPALARRHGLSTRRIRQICNGDGVDDRQLGLFDPPPK